MDMELMPELAPDFWQVFLMVYLNESRPGVTRAYRTARRVYSAIHLVMHDADTPLTLSQVRYRVHKHATQIEAARAVHHIETGDIREHVIRSSMESALAPGHPSNPIWLDHGKSYAISRTPHRAWMPEAMLAWPVPYMMHAMDYIGGQHPDRWNDTQLQADTHGWAVQQATRAGLAASELPTLADLTAAMVHLLANGSDVREIQHALATGWAPSEIVEVCGE